MVYLQRFAHRSGDGMFLPKPHQTPFMTLPDGTICRWSSSDRDALKQYQPPMSRAA
jgi:hypothetical protein